MEPVSEEAKFDANKPSKKAIEREIKRYKKKIGQAQAVLVRAE